MFDKKTHPHALPYSTPRKHPPPPHSSVYGHDSCTCRQDTAGSCLGRPPAQLQESRHWAQFFTHQIFSSTGMKVEQGPVQPSFSRRGPKRCTVGLTDSDLQVLGVDVQVSAPSEHACHSNTQATKREVQPESREFVGGLWRYVRPCISWWLHYVSCHFLSRALGWNILSFSVVYCPTRFYISPPVHNTTEYALLRKRRPRLLSA